MVSLNLRMDALWENHDLLHCMRDAKVVVRADGIEHLQVGGWLAPPSLVQLDDAADVAAGDNLLCTVACGEGEIERERKGEYVRACVSATAGTLGQRSTPSRRSLERCFLTYLKPLLPLFLHGLAQLYIGERWNGVLATVAHIKSANSNFEVAHTSNRTEHL